MTTQTIGQYMASVRRCGNCPDDLRYQTQAWPYPQADQSHIAVWRDSWPHEPGMMPARQLRIPVVNSDIPGLLMRIASDAPKPREVVAELLAVD